MSGRKVNCPLGSVGHGCPRNMSARISVSVPVKSGTSDAGSVVLKKYRSCTVGPVGGHSCPGAAQCTPRGGKGGTSTLKHVHPWSLSCFGLRPPAWLAAATGNANATAATSGIMNRRIRVSPLAAYGRKYSPPKAAAVSTRRPDGLTGQGLRDESAWSPHFEVGDRGCGPLLIAAPAQSLHRRRLRPHRENSPCCAFRLPIFGDEPQLEGRSAGLAPGVGVELAKHRGDVVVDRLRRDGQTVCDLRVPETRGDQLEHLELARRQVGGIAPCRNARTSRQAARATLAQTARDNARGGTSAQPVQLVERTANDILLVGLGQGEGGLVRTIELGPELGRSCPVARDLDRVRLGSFGRDLFSDPRPPAPVRELADHPRGVPSDCE